MDDAVTTIAGHICWITVTITYSQHMIVALNVETEEFITIDTPPQALEGSARRLRLAKLQERLWLVNGFISTNTVVGLDLKLWMLQESSCEWIMKHRIVLHSIKYAWPLFMGFFYIHKGKLVFKPCREGTT